MKRETIAQKRQKIISWDNIVFVATHNDDEYLRRFQRVSRVETTIHNVSDNFFPIDDEPINTPYMFILDSDSTFKELFISMKGNDVRTKQYLERITKVYF